jgi:hypothetical protein
MAMQPDDFGFNDVPPSNVKISNRKTTLEPSFEAISGGLEYESTVRFGRRFERVTARWLSFRFTGG